MRCWRRRRLNDRAEKRVKVIRQMVPAWVYVDGGVKGLDEDGLFNAPLDPIMLRGKDGNVLFAKVVVVFASMLQHCRLVLPKSIGGSRGVLLEAGSCSAFSLTNIPAWARCGVSTSTGYVVDDAGLFFPWESILGLYKHFPEGST